MATGTVQHTSLLVSATLLPGLVLYVFCSGLGSSMPAEIIAGWYVVCMIYEPMIAETGMKLFH
jgi:hypothetical protein